MNLEFQNSSPQLSESDIDIFESKTGVKIPEEYRLFLSKHNGGYPEPGDFLLPDMVLGSQQDVSVDGFLGIDAESYFDLEKYLIRYGDRIPASLFPIAAIAGGDLICISTAATSEGQIYYWLHDEESDDDEPATFDNVYLIARNLEELLMSLHL